MMNIKKIAKIFLEAWDGVSQAAKDLITKMLVKIPEDRLSCDDFLVIHLIF